MAGGSPNALTKAVMGGLYRAKANRTVAALMNLRSWDKGSMNALTIRLQRLGKPGRGGNLLEFSNSRVNRAVGWENYLKTVYSVTDTLVPDAGSFMLGGAIHEDVRAWYNLAQGNAALDITCVFIKSASGGFVKEFMLVSEPFNAPVVLISGWKRRNPTQMFTRYI